jgi:hypothetical protein
MEVAFHFIAEHELVARPYHLPILRKFFEALLADGPPPVRTFIRIGDLGLHDLAEEVETSPNGMAQDIRYGQEALTKAIDDWIAPEEGLWSHKMDEAWGKAIFVVHLAKCTPEVAAKIDRTLKEWPPYGGARRISPGSTIRPIYAERLVRMFFLSGAHLRRLWDGDPNEEPDRALIDLLRELPFASIGRAHIPAGEDEDRLDDLLGIPPW